MQWYIELKKNSDMRKKYKVRKIMFVEDVRLVPYKC